MTDLKAGLKPGVREMLVTSDEWRRSADLMVSAHEGHPRGTAHAGAAVMLYAHAATSLLSAAALQAEVWPSQSSGFRAVQQLATMGALPSPDEEIAAAFRQFDADFEAVLRTIQATPRDQAAHVAAPEVDVGAAKTAVVLLRDLVDAAITPRPARPEILAEADRLRREGLRALNDGLRSPAEIAAFHLAAAQAALDAITNDAGVTLPGVRGMARRWDVLAEVEVIRFTYPAAREALEFLDALEVQVRHDGRNPSVQQLDRATDGSRRVIEAAAEIITDRTRFDAQRAARAAEADDGPSPS